MKRKWYILFLGVPFLFCSEAKAQYFSYLYDNDTTGDFGRNVILQQDGSYFIFEGGNRKGIQQKEVKCYQISSDGLVVTNKREYAVPNLHLFMGDYGKIALTPSGYIIPLIADAGLAYKIQAAGMMKINSNGDSVFSAYYTDTSHQMECSYDISCAKNAQRYYLAGVTYDTSLALDSAFGLLLVTDSNGQVLTRKKLANKAGIPQVLNMKPGVMSELHSVECLADGNILIGASNGNIDALVDSRNYSGPSSAHMRPWYILADSMGNIIKDKTFGDEYTGGGNVRTDKSGGYLAWGMLFKLMIPNQAVAYQNYPAYVSHLDGDFNLVWRYVFGDTLSHTTVNKTMQLSNGDYLVIGAKQVYGIRSGWAARLTRNGKIKWEHNYQLSLTDTNDYKVVVDASERANGSLVFIGSSFRNTSLPAYRGQDTWLLSVDSNGCEVPGCSYTAVAVPQVPITVRGDIIAYPNPTTGQLNIQSSEQGTLALYNLQGMIVGMYEIKRGSTGFYLPSNLTAGVYTGRFIGRNGRSNSMLRIVYQP